MFKVLIADDERLSRERLRKMLGNFHEFSVVGEASDGDSAAAFMENGGIDIAFLDIEMPGKNIFSVLQELKQKPYIVFQTAYSEFAVDAFECDAVDYLLKPVSTVRLAKCIDKIKKTFTTTPPADEISGIPKTDGSKEILTLKIGSEIKIITIDEISSVIGENGITKITMKNGDVYFSEKFLNYFEEQLTSAFIRTSRTGIINLSVIKTIKTGFNGCYEVECKNGDSIRVSRRRGIELKKVLGI